MNRMRKPDHGGLGIWILLGILFVGIFSGFKVGRLYFDHSTLEEEARSFAKNALTSQRFAGVQGEIEEKLRWIGAEYDPEKIQVNVSDNEDEIDLYAPYQRRLDLMGMEFPMDFVLRFRERLPEVGGVMKEMRDRVQDSYSQSSDRTQDAVKKAFSD